MQSFFFGYEKCLRLFGRCFLCSPIYLTDDMMQCILTVPSLIVHLVWRARGLFRKEKA